jgi:uncharacterized protein involved in response to NO
MMTRTARGHTAQPLRADRWDVIAYVTWWLQRRGARVRAAARPSAIVVAGAGIGRLAWSAGWPSTRWHYGPWLCRATRSTAAPAEPP